MLLIKVLSKLRIKYLLQAISSRYLQTKTSNISDVAENPLYPPIVDISFVAKWRRKHDLWHEQVKQVPTVEEKCLKLNMPRYWGFKCLMINEGSVYYNELPQAQYITRTYISQESSLPVYYDNLISTEKLNNLIENLKELIEQGVAFELAGRNRTLEQKSKTYEDSRKVDDLIGTVVSKQVNRLMSSVLAQDYPHLLDVQMDYDPRIEAAWFFGGINTTNEVKISLKKNHCKEALNEPIDRKFQYLGTPILQLRHHYPLNELIPVTECENPQFQVPEVKFDPRTYGKSLKRRHITSLPGFWPGDSCEFGYISYHKRGYLLGRSKEFNDEVDALKTHAIFSNYGWLLSQASHLGFSTFNDITYPLVNQMIITNGQYWSFSAYQLNTILFNQSHADKNPKRNICWITDPIKLYEKIENNKLVGFNDEVIRNLIKFYINVPHERVGINMKPYLGVEEQKVADIKDDDKRIWLEKRYKHLMSSRPRHRRMPELFLWQRIYKHMFKTRPMDKKRTHYDYGINPFIRRLDNHCPDYIPKALRPDDERKVKFAKTYYPK
ncbi:Similar to MRPS30: 39S ribosomal protein S30 [Cotesia congregata]|uniref:Mitochondrial (Homo sapiens) n=1 Tax=Cotesia congregata TaxID=51543 RepID=A0A8J2HL19_COTCN|nr:Similar to MRPS30: 39S ribosomal protein S30 [Cotesia congregata]